MNGTDSRTEANTLHEQKLLEAVKDLLKTKHGRHFLRWLVLETDTCKACFVDDAAKCAFREGQRAVGSAVLSLVVKARGAQIVLEEEDLNG